jgi:hypothetical protein
MAKVFISYSHKDEALRNEMENHLAMLKRDGTIETWHDRRIVAGSNLDTVISENLESAEVILLLVSASFLASDYCYDIEMGRALEKSAEGSAVVIPVILRPCDWRSSPFGKLRATPTDGKEVTMFANQDEAFGIVAKDVRTATKRFQVAAPVATAPAAAAYSVAAAAKFEPDMRSSNMRVKRKFDDHERDEFLDNAYEYIARFFEGSLRELEARYQHIKTRFKRVDASSFTAHIYDNGKNVAQCSVVAGGQGGFGGNGIRYSNSGEVARNSFNEQLTVGDDGYTLHLKGGLFQGQDKTLAEQGAAELYWGLLMRPLQ